jgi:hypothetical protein
MHHLKNNTPINRNLFKQRLIVFWQGELWNEKNFSKDKKDGG